MHRNLLVAMLRNVMVLGVLGWISVASAAVPATVADRPVPLRGTIVSYSGTNLKLREADGDIVSIKLLPNFRVAGVARRSLASIKPGEFVASTSVKGADGQLHAIEVHIFPPSMNGVRKGQFPWNLEPGSLMTNAIVSGIARKPQGEALTVTYNGKSTTVLVSQNTPIVALVPGSPALMKPGAYVFVLGQKEPNGTIVAANVTAEDNGVKPPM